MIRHMKYLVLSRKIAVSNFHWADGTNEDRISHLQISETLLSGMGIHLGVDLFSYVEKESAYDFFNILALREWNPILYKLHTDTQYVCGLSVLFDLDFRLQQISQFFTGLLCFWHNKDIINIDEKQNFTFNQQAWFFQADFELNGFHEIWQSKVAFSSLLFEAIHALLN